MKTIFLTAIVALSLFLVCGGCKCSRGSAGLGVVSGVVADGGSDEYGPTREMKKIAQDYTAGKIEQHEYEIRKDLAQSIFLLGVSEPPLPVEEIISPTGRQFVSE